MKMRMMHASTFFQRAPEKRERTRGDAAEREGAYSQVENNNYIQCNLTIL
jgi:hypothetical protein